VYCELSHVLGWRHTLGERLNFHDIDLALDLPFMDVVQSVVRDDQRAFLRPFKHVRFLYLACVQEDVYKLASLRLTTAQQLHTCVVLLESDVVDYC
jgi:hypothetical protein